MNATAFQGEVVPHARDSDQGSLRKINSALVMGRKLRILPAALTTSASKKEKWFGVVNLSAAAENVVVKTKHIIKSDDSTAETTGHTFALQPNQPVFIQDIIDVDPVNADTIAVFVA